MSKTIYDIFISYRRNGGFETAKHLNDLLVHDGYSVSFDIDTLREGRFDNALLSRIEQCTDFILVVDKNTFDRMKGSDPSEDDWLRQELSYALRLKKNIIPVLLAGAVFPSNLPADVNEVRYKNGPAYSKEYFDTFYAKLKSFIHALPRYSDTTTENREVLTSKLSSLKIKSDLDCVFFLDGVEKVKIEAGKIQKIQLPVGEYELKFVSIENQKDIIEMVFTMQESDKIVLVDFKKMRGERETAGRGVLHIHYNAFWTLTEGKLKLIVNDKEVGVIKTKHDYDLDIPIYSPNITIKLKYPFSIGESLLPSSRKPERSYTLDCKKSYNCEISPDRWRGGLEYTMKDQQGNIIPYL